MAVSIAFGLAYATLLILLIVPSLLSIYEDVREWMAGADRGVSDPVVPG